MRLFGIGEPLTNPDFLEMARIAKSYPAQTLFHTNGMLMGEGRIAEQIVESMVDLVIFSIDGVDQKTIDQIRVGANLEQVKEGVQKLRRIRDQVGSTKPELEICFNCMTNNLQQIPEIIDFAAALGVEKVQYQYVIPYNAVAHKRTVTAHEQNTLRSLFEDAKRRAACKHVTIIRIPRHHTFSGTRQPCSFPFRDLYVRSDGIVTACNYFNYKHTTFFHVQHGELVEGQKEAQPLIMGNLAEEPVVELYNNRAYQRLRESWESGELREPCSYCYFPYEMH
jgi:MoaA/NifB/PqqE/SkfB family radical SAM enzyme